MYILIYEVYFLVVSWDYFLEERDLFSPQVLRFLSISLQFLTSNPFGCLTVPAHSFYILKYNISWSESMVTFTVTTYSFTLLCISGFSSHLMFVLSAQFEEHSS